MSLQKCEREYDVNIKNLIVNDFEHFIRYKNIDTLILTERKADFFIVWTNKRHYVSGNNAFYPQILCRLKINYIFGLQAYSNL
jgi:hypothetical protein